MNQRSSIEKLKCCVLYDGYVAMGLPRVMFQPGISVCPDNALGSLAVTIHVRQEKQQYGVRRLTIPSI